MTAEVYLNISGTRYYLNGEKVAYTGSGTPWTTQATSPIALGMNDVTGQKWTPVASVPDVIYASGPPLANDSVPLFWAYPRTTETIPIQIYATSEDNALEVLKRLRQNANRTINAVPAEIGVKSANGTFAVFAPIHRFDVQETPSFFNDEAGLNIIRANITLTRGPFFTPATSEAIAINGVTFANNGGAASPNSVAWGALTGDLTNEGMPTRVIMNGGTLANTTAKVIYMATARNVFYTARGDAISTTSTSGANVGSPTAILIGGTSVNSRLRFIARLASPTSNLQIRVIASYATNLGATVGSAFYASDWATPGAVGGAYVDLGYWNIPRRYVEYGPSYISIQVQARSTNGASATATLTYIEQIQYHTWCRLDSTTTVPSGSYFTAAQTRAGGGGRFGIAILRPPIVAAVSSLSSILQPLNQRGTLPVAMTDTSLYLAWTDGGVHTSTDTITVTGRYAPLYLTFRGGA